MTGTAMKNSGFLRAYRNYNHYYNYGHMYEMDWAVEGQQNVAPFRYEPSPCWGRVPSCQRQQYGLL